MRLLRSQDGVSMAEVMVAMLILAAGSLAVLNLIGASAHSSFRNQQAQVVSDRLQQEVEKIQHLPYDQIALTGVPAGSGNQSSPAWRVQGTSYAVNRDGTQPAPLAYNGSALYTGGSICDSNHNCGVVDPTPTTFTDGNVSGTIYRYVVWLDDPTCGASCPGAQDLKRIIVAIALNTTAPGGVHPYQEIQTQVTDPQSEPISNSNPGGGGPGGGGPGSGCIGGSDCSGGQCTGTSCTSGQCNGSDCIFPTPWTFWLTDTSCNNTSRQPLTGDHLLHSTDGNCSSGTKDSSNCSTNVFNVTSCPAGAPDLMVTNPPLLTAETPLYNYSSDLTPVHKGLVMPKPSSTVGNGCLTNSLFQPLTSLGSLVPDPDTTRSQTIHKWLSNPVTSGFNVSLTGDATLDLWTKSVDGVAYSGNLCIWIFKRNIVSGLPVDTPVVTFTGNLSYFTHSESPWPTGWTELHIPLEFNLGVTLAPASQLGLALQVERAGTSGGGLNFLYDEPSFDSRFQVNTIQNQLPF
jgi:hypothetical protein